MIFSEKHTTDADILNVPTSQIFDNIVVFVNFAKYMDLTGIARHIFAARSREISSWQGKEQQFQQNLLKKMLKSAASTSFGHLYDFNDIVASSDPVETFKKNIPIQDYEGFRNMIVRMMRGEKDVLWPGKCDYFAQSSGTTGGRTKYIPVTKDGLKHNHYKGASCSVALYLAENPQSRMFAGKGLVLGGSFATDFASHREDAHIGDLSATLIECINPFANFFRVPDKKTALLEDWAEKLPLLAEKAAKSDITNLSGVPSWMMRVLLKVLEIKGAHSLAEVWPHLEVFFHGGISFAPYKAEYARLCEGLDMHWIEVYNASEGYFATGDTTREKGMLLLVDAGVYFEFLPLGSDTPVDIPDLKTGKVYELVVTSCNGLWRYRTGDTVRIENLDPLRISIAGRTKSFINAFGEELMEDNAEHAVAEACRRTGASIANYCAGPLYAHEEQRGRHQWLIEWNNPPASVSHFAEILDEELRKANSDYDAKRGHSLFLDPPEIISARHGLFDLWLSESGSGKLGGQRKIPRLHNSREIIERLISLNNQ